MKRIKLSRGKVALVDDDDYDVLVCYRWYAVNVSDRWYAARGIVVDGKRTTEYMHRAIMDGEVVSHLDGNGLNNRRGNLVVRTVREVSCGRAVRGFSKYRGVSINKGVWCAYITVGGRKKYLGGFSTEVAAADAYNKAAIEIHGECANLNKFVI